MAPKIRDKDILAYHEFPRPGKTSVTPTKPCLTQRDLSIAYTPGVALPCLKIEKDPSLAARYTNRSNLVAVITNGTAVLGLGDIGPLAGKPVMEGKGVLFNRFAGIDVFDIELDTKDVEEFISAVRLMAPTFGGINLEDIKAPECFEIEERLEKELDIPVFHDDQHGTAIIATAGMINALHLQNKKAEDAQIVILGAGAAGIAISNMMLGIGVKRENCLMVDRRGVIYAGREQGMNRYKERVAVETDARTLADAMKGADIFLGVSGPNLVSNEMLLSMAPNPIIFAMANPDPEVSYELARELRPDSIVATGRSDYPNQVNNVLGFPFLFRAALDVGAREINMPMKVAAANALAKLTRADIPDEVLQAYDIEELHFGPEYIIPKPLDSRVLLYVAPAVAEAAVESGVADPKKWKGLEAYRNELGRFLGPAWRVMGTLADRARRHSTRLVFCEGENQHVIRAAQRMLDEKICQPILIGRERVIREVALEHDLPLDGIEIINPKHSEHREHLRDRYYALRQRRGVAPRTAERRILDPTIFGMMMVEESLADGLVGGINRSYRQIVTPALEIIGPRPGVNNVASTVVAIHQEHLYFLTDPSLNIFPNPQAIAEMAILTAETARNLFHVEPRVALLSYSNFGSVKHRDARRMADALKIIQEADPELIVDGEMRLGTAVCPETAAVFPHSRIQGDANVLVYPCLSSANLSYMLLAHFAKAEILGPFLCGLAKPANVLNHTASVEEIVRVAAVTALQSRQLSKAQ